MTTDAIVSTVERLLDMIDQREKEIETARAEQSAFMDRCRANPDKVIAWLNGDDPDETLGEALSKEVVG